jgi:hypothetical protein
LAEVAAPAGRGRDAAETATVAATDTGTVAAMETGSVGVLGETATTIAGSVATGAVEAALTATVLVPSLTLVVWLPRVVWLADVEAPVGSAIDATETGSVGVLGEMVTTAAQSVATGAVLGALTAVMLAGVVGSLMVATVLLLTYPETKYEKL